MKSAFSPLPRDATRARRFARDLALLRLSSSTCCERDVAESDSDSQIDSQADSDGDGDSQADSDGDGISEAGGDGNSEASGRGNSSASAKSRDAFGTATATFGLRSSCTHAPCDTAGPGASAV